MTTTEILRVKLRHPDNLRRPVQIIHSYYPKTPAETEIYLDAAVKNGLGGFVVNMDVHLPRQPEETEEGYKYFVLYSTPNYSQMQLNFSVENDSTLAMNIKKTLFAKTITDVPVTTDVAVYECGWTSNDNGGRDFSDFDKVTFAEK